MTDMVCMTIIVVAFIILVGFVAWVRFSTNRPKVSGVTAHDRSGFHACPAWVYRPCYGA